MISKELLSEVLGYEINDFMIKDNLLKYDALYSLDMSNNHKAYGYRKSINIYELVHKCKEFAYKLNFNILTEKVSENGYFGYIIKTNQLLECYGYIQEIKVVYETIHNQTEAECIFIACQWILENKDK